MNSIEGIDLNLLRVFKAIVEERSLTRAGERLSLSQPAVSHCLGKLRTLFDDPLFVRTRTGMQPTTAALEIAAIVSKALDSVQFALRYAQRFEPLVSARTFRLSVSDAGELAYLPAIWSALQQAAPNVRLGVSPLPVDEIEEALRCSNIDFAVGNLPTLKPRTRNLPLFDETYVCITRKRKGLPVGRTISLPALQKARHVQVSSAEHSHHAIDAAFVQEGVKRHVVLEVPHFVALPDVLAATDWYATVPHHLAAVFAQDYPLRIYEFPVDLPRAAVTLHWHENFESDEANVWMRQLLTDVIQGFDKRWA
ncbi:LysR family transcriptional regulator [Pandoraea sputorum]|uniref:Nodulation protein D 2 n=1 Tax=Pandoraea sputorum TaxID=93222 RepID=A0A239SPW9_9BURK|nr:LysR family transcriptional regulator [Pandoraea sputorum]AJC18145.1 LysR family transcriptional regulator [Pandoraea sputorum]SNU87460.1 Nodulation protein D 2 [Pandoraea sputorum]VVE50843.1 LysR family transcriptional regulator [Pandoraea sputorum]VVE85471.1 LysR family transcriptional regulator [Pandoraea sputorum]BET11301.1 LysR family transcriptional regulator [Pandoraea sputorum]